MYGTPYGGRFQSTHPCGVRLGDHEPYVNLDNVSIHAPLRGATLGCARYCGMDRGFNPRTPAGCDTKARIVYWIDESFNPRTPAGCDFPSLFFGRCRYEFQSTHPCGVRPTSGTLGRQRDCVSIHAPLRGATPRLQLKLGMPLGFNPRTPAGCDG